MKLRNLPYLLFTLLIAGICITGCKKEKLLNSGGELRFSVDTLKFDTVFTSLGSFTATIKIYNPQNQPVKLSSVRLEKPNDGQFSINVNGITSNSVADIELAAKDSMYVFATVNIDPSNLDNPFVVENALLATLNGKEFKVPFIAFGQNAYYIVDSVIDQTQTWKTDKPYVIIHNAAVDENITLTIPAKCRVYVHGDSRLIVLGTLKVMGTEQDSVIFQGDRLDRKYFGNEGYPGEWGGIYFSSTSRDNEIHYARFINGGASTKLGEGVFTAATIQLNYDTISTSGAQLTMTNSIIENSLGHGILAFGSTLVANNCLINSCGAQCLAVFEGGGYYLDNCTFANYGTKKVNHIDNPVMGLLNYRDITNVSYVAGPLICSLNNCVVWGSLETEFVAQSRGTINDPNKPETQYSITLQNCLVKNKDGFPKDINAINSKINEDPKFRDYGALNFRPGDGSPLIDAGIKLPTTPLKDLDKKMRIEPVDIGCYEAH